MIIEYINVKIRCQPINNMTELTTGGFQKWKNMLSSNVIAPIAFDRQNEENEISTPIVICLKSFNGISNKVK